MRVLTICQPYATLIAMGRKPIENRTWYTLYRGPLGIHAGKSRAWLDNCPAQNMRDQAEFDRMPFGALVAIAELVDCVEIKDLDRKHPDLADNEHAEGPWCWILRDVHRLLTPVACAGHQGMWHLHDQILNEQELVKVV